MLDYKLSIFIFNVIVKYNLNVLIFTKDENSLGGKIPSELGKLSNLKNINFSIAVLDYELSLYFFNSIVEDNLIF